MAQRYYCRPSDIAFGDSFSAMFDAICMGAGEERDKETVMRLGPTLGPVLAMAKLGKLTGIQ